MYANVYAYTVQFFNQRDRDILIQCRQKVYIHFIKIGIEVFFNIRNTGTLSLLRRCFVFVGEKTYSESKKLLRTINRILIILVCTRNYSCVLVIEGLDVFLLNKRALVPTLSHSQ